MVGREGLEPGRYRKAPSMSTGSHASIGGPSYKQPGRVLDFEDQELVASYDHQGIVG
jgi:hypothetical protein